MHSLALAIAALDLWSLAAFFGLALCATAGEG
jgi:hypothetical protein